MGFWGQADNTVIRFERIHDVGQCEAYDHLIYVSHGNNVQIYDNWLYNDPHGDAVQLYPGADQRSGVRKRDRQRRGGVRDRQ